MRAALLIATAALVAGHGHMTLPASTRHGGSIATGGACANQACFWFSNNVQIPTAPTLPNDMRTVQLNVTERPHDVYATSPWRAPGSAPVFGSGCGVAGGSKEVYLNGGAIKGFPQGMDGKDLNKSTAAPPTWKRGETARVAQAITANHGGGYSYRLCPADEPGGVTEACFQRTPLAFDVARKQSFRWGGLNGTQVWFNGDYVSEGTNPPGSLWVKNPVPRNDGTNGKGFTPKCEEVPDCGTTAVESKCLCSGMWGPYNLEIVDYVVLPASLKPGKWVLGWRWDCEESNQVWSSCSDVTITN